MEDNRIVNKNWTWRQTMIAKTLQHRKLLIEQHEPNTGGTLVLPQGKQLM